MNAPNRRVFFRATAATTAAACLAAKVSKGAPLSPQHNNTLEARKKNIEWPVWDETEENALLDVLNSGTWGRTGGGPKCAAFEAAFAKRMQAKHCVLTASGTTAC